MDQIHIQEHSIFTLKSAKKLILVLLMVFVFDFFLFSAPAYASEFSTDITEDIALSNEPVIPENSLPENSEVKVIRTSYHTITAYNSEVGQCDSTPCITANGFNVCEHGIEDTIAANFLKFGTKVRIPELFGDRVFIVRDRMNARYDSRIDVWMLNKADAKQFGVKIAQIEVLEP